MRKEFWAKLELMKKFSAKLEEEKEKRKKRRRTRRGTPTKTQKVKKNPGPPAVVGSYPHW